MLTVYSFMAFNWPFTPDADRVSTVSTKSSLKQYTEKLIMAIYRPPAAEEGRPADYGQQRSGSGGVPQVVPRVVVPQDDDTGSATPGPQPVVRNRNVLTSIRCTVDAVNDNRHVRHFHKFRVMCGDLVNHPRMQMLVIVLIVINAIMMGVGTFDFVMDNEKVENAFETTDQVFLVLFTIELVLQFVFRGYTLFYDRWLVFDFVIIVLSWSFAQLQIIRAFRIFRALRIINRIETMRNLVAALFDIMPRLGAITALLLLIFYIFAVLFTQLFGDLELSGNYFTTLDASFLTLFVMMTMEWADVARECMDEVWWAWAPFVAFIMITGFIVFNLIIAVVCDAVAVIENKGDLQGDLFEGMHMMGTKSDDQSGEAEANGVNGAYAEAADAGMPMSYEEQLVENLAERMASVLDAQKEMLATLESLARDTVPPTRPRAQRGDVHAGEEDEAPGR